MCFLFLEQNISRRIGAFEIRGERADDHAFDLTAIEQIVLYDYMGMLVARFEPEGSSKSIQ